MFELIDEGKSTEREKELPAEDIETTGLIAHVDLFAVNPPRSAYQQTSQEQPQLDPTPGSSTNPNWEAHPQEAGSSHSGPPREEDVIDIDEGAVLTSAVFGSSFVHAVKIQDMVGETVILFVFADLSVKIEGHFVYRYRCFNLFSRVAGSDNVPITAELYSGVFVIYSTKEFPGLQASTAITKHLGRWGVRVNLRETSRGKRNKHGGGDEDEDEDGGSSGGGETTVDEEQGVQFYTPNFLASLTDPSAESHQIPQILFGPPASNQQDTAESTHSDKGRFAHTR